MLSMHAQSEQASVRQPLDSHPPLLGVVSSCCIYNQNNKGKLGCANLKWALQLVSASSSMCTEQILHCTNNAKGYIQTDMHTWCALQHLRRDLSWLMMGSWLVKKVTTSCWNSGSMSPGNCCSNNSRLDMFLKVSSLLSSCSSSSLPMYKSSSSAAMHSSKVDTHVEPAPHTAQIHQFCIMNRLTSAPREVYHLTAGA